MAQGLRFNGLTDYVSVPDTPLLKGFSAFTITARVSNLINADTGIVSKWGSVLREYLFGLTPAGFQFVLKILGGTYSAFVSYTPSVNDEICGIYDGNNIILYVNGVEVARTTGVTGVIDSTTQPFEIGRHDGAKYAKGTVSIVRTYNRALTAREIAANYAGTVTRSGLVGEWLFQAGAGSTAFDTSGNGNNGTITGATWVQPKKQQGLRFNGLTDYLLLPAMNVDAIDIEAKIDSNQTQQPAYYLFDGRNLATLDNFAYSGGIGSNVSNFYQDGVSKASPLVTNITPDKRSLFTTKFTAPVTTPVYIFSRYTLAEYMKGEVYSITCYRNGAIVAKYLLNEGTGTTATDTSGNGKHGTINGATWLVKKAPQKARKNMLDANAWVGGRTYDNNFLPTSWSKDPSGNVTINGAAGAFVSQKVTVIPYTNYVINFSASDANNEADIYTTSGVVVAAIQKGQSFNSGGNNSLIIGLYKGATTGSITFTNPQLELGTTATAYEPYTLIDGSKIGPSKPKKQMLPPFTDPRWTLHENTRMQVADFSGKVSGSTVANPHYADSWAGTSLAAPIPIERVSPTFSNSDYQNVSTLDGSLRVTANSTNGNSSWQQFSFNVIEHIIRKFGASVFGTAVTLADRVAWVKAGNVSKFNCNWSGFGSGPAGNKATLKYWNQTSVVWGAAGAQTHSLSTVSKLTWGSSGIGVNILDMIDVNGFVHFLAYSDASDGITASTINTDTVNLEVYLTEAAYAPLRQAYTLGLNATAGGQQNSVTVAALPNTQYSMSGTISGAVNDMVIDIYCQDAFGVNTYSGATIRSTTPTVTFTSRADCVKLFVKTYNNLVTGSLTISNPQLELGSAATAFEAYQLVPDMKLIPLVPKKNMLPSFNSGNWTLPTTLNLSDYSVTIDQAAGTPIFTASVIPGKQYTLSGLPISNSNGAGTCFIEVWQNGAFLAQVAQNGTPVTFTAGYNSLQIKLTHNTSGGSNYTFTNPQLELGSVATPFESYKLIPNVKQL